MKATVVRLLNLEGDMRQVTWLSRMLNLLFSTIVKQRPVGIQMVMNTLVAATCMVLVFLRILFLVKLFIRRP